MMLELRTLESDDWPIWRELRLAALAEAPYVFGSTLAEWKEPVIERNAGVLAWRFLVRAMS